MSRINSDYNQGIKNELNVHDNVQKLDADDLADIKRANKQIRGTSPSQGKNAEDIYGIKHNCAPDEFDKNKH